jgi:endonuclease/exonuclease/phosphatase family metal-dependent hydrolase
MTWNIRGGLVRPGDEGPKSCRPKPASEDSPYLIGIAKEIRRHAGLDVVALQEVYRSQANELKRMLYTHLGTNLDLHFFRTIDCDDIGDQYGLAIFSRYKFLEDSGRTVQLCTRCPGNEPRVLARVKISVHGHPVHIYNTHFPPGGDVHFRMASLISYQVAFVDRPDRAVLLGDFYFSPHRSAYNTLTSVFTDAWVRHHGDKECENTNPTVQPSQRDDYVFVKGSFRVDAARVTCRKDLLDAFGLTKTSPNVWLRLPDHLPLTVSLALVD